MAKLQGAIIGFGNIAEKGHWPSYAASDEAEIVAVMDPSRARQDAARAKRPDIRCYNSVDELFSTEKVDFVDICTPPASHAGIAINALKHKSHVLCEKPLALGTADYEVLAKEAIRQGQTLFAVHNWKYAPIYQKAFSLIKEGRIGKIWHVELFVQRDNVCKGTAQGAGESATTRIEDWRKDASVAGGGILVDHGWHAFYLLLNLVGAEPERLLAKMVMPEDNPTGLEEVVQSLVQFPEADGYINLTWRAPIRRNSALIQGQSGTLLVDDDRLLLTTHSGSREEIAFDKPLSSGSHHAEWFQPLLADFIQEIKTPAKRGANLREAGWCVALTSAAYESNLLHFQEVPVLFPGIPKKESVNA